MIVRWEKIKNLGVRENGKIQIAKMKINLYSYLGSHSKHTYYVLCCSLASSENTKFRFLTIILFNNYTA